MEFVSNIEDMLKVVGTVVPTGNRTGIQMSLPEEVDCKEEPLSIHRIVYGTTESGKRYIETISMKQGSWPVYGEASIPEILAFAKKAEIDLPESEYTKELSRLASWFKAALK
jgi:hypothetical protein